MITRDTFKRGLTNSSRTIWMLVKIIVPVYAAVTILKHTGVVDWLGRLFEPVMGFVGLPGEAGVAFVTGSLVNLYAGVGIVMAMDLTPLQLTIIGVMLNISHELIVESAVLKKAGLTVWPLAAFRFGGAFLVGGTIHLLFGGG